MSWISTLALFLAGAVTGAGLLVLFAWRVIEHLFSRCAHADCKSSRLSISLAMQLLAHKLSKVDDETP